MSGPLRIGYKDAWYHAMNRTGSQEELAEHFSDMVYSCFYEQSQIKISLLFEHNLKVTRKSYPDNNLPYQLLKYMVRIWEYNVKQKEGKLQ